MAMATQDRKTARRQGGATLMEFVITLPFAIVFVLALVQMGFIYMAKLNLNHATFMAARTGALNNANEDIIRDALVRGLIPFHQNVLNNDDAARMSAAWLAAKTYSHVPGSLSITRLNPSAQSFEDFGVRDPVRRVTYIPNDNLEWRTDWMGPRSRQTLRDANLLKLRVVYSYELKVPLISRFIEFVMCGGRSGVEGFGNVSGMDAVHRFGAASECLLHYRRGRMPIEASAIVEMQSRAERR